MRLSRPLSLLLGVATITPLVYIAIFLAYFMPQFQSLGQGGLNPRGFFDLLFLVSGLHLIVLMFILALLMVYMTTVTRSDIPMNRKSTWILALLLGNVVVMPVFWYLHIWRVPRDENPGN